MNFAAEAIAPEDVAVVIPARYGSSRFPGKALAPLWGKPMIAHVVAAALAARRVGKVAVATDDQRIAHAARQAGAEAFLTRKDHPTGSDRIGEVLAQGTWPVVLNVQGDEPAIPPAAIDRLVELLEKFPSAAVSTLASPLKPGSPEHLSPNVVKVVRDAAGRALYFSRAPIPGRHPGGGGQGAELRGGKGGKDEMPPGAAFALRHVGLYGFRREAFERFLAHAPTPLETAEGLEQLRFLEMGETIVVGVIESLPPGVDTPEDLARIQASGRP